MWVKVNKIVLRMEPWQMDVRTKTCGWWFSCDPCPYGLIALPVEAQARSADARCKLDWLLPVAYNLRKAHMVEPTIIRQGNAKEGAMKVRMLAGVLAAKGLCTHVEPSRNPLLLSLN